MKLPFAGIVLSLAVVGCGSGGVQQKGTTSAVAAAAGGTSSGSSGVGHASTTTSSSASGGGSSNGGGVTTSTGTAGAVSSNGISSSSGAASSSGGSSGMLTATGCAMPIGACPASGLLFEDDFSSGDLSKFNAYFRWGDGTTLIQPGQKTMPVVTTSGPDGGSVDAIEFTYGTWQEVRFALTESATEMRASSNASSSVAYPDLYTCYAVFLPTNYYQSSNGVGAVNDKWFTLWKNGYQTSNSGVGNWFELLPTGTGDSQASGTDNQQGGLNTHVSYVLPADAYGTDGAYAIRTSESGQWHDYCYHTRVPLSSTSHDGVMEVYKDGALHFAWDNIVYWAPDGVAANAGFDRGYILGYHNSVVPAGSQIWYVTNFRIGTTAASVGL